MVTSKKRLVTGWRAVVVFILLLFVTPLFTILSSLFQSYSSDTWSHLLETVLQSYIINSLVLMVGVGLGTFVIGVLCAWLVCLYDFPGRKIFEWALLLPMALPAYILAYSYTGLLDFSGPIQTSIREIFGWSYGDYWFPEIRSMGGAIAMLSLVLYPYVYLIARSSFLEQSRSLLDVSRSFGNGHWKTFIRVSIPLARPAIVAGCSLAMMEALADYGTVQYFGISTFTTGIYRTWFGMGEMQTAAQLSSMLMLFVFTLLILERYSRAKMKFHHATNTQRALSLVKPSVFKKMSIFLFCSLVLFFGFILPVIQLVYWALVNWESSFDDRFWEISFNSFFVAATASFTCLVVGLFMVIAQRIRQDKFENISLRMLSLGYATPGLVIAVGVMIPLTMLDIVIDDFFVQNFEYSPGLLLSGSLFVLILAYSVRFIAVALGSLESGLQKIRQNIDFAAQSLGADRTRIIFRIHMPLLRSSIFAALVLVFVDVLKELPATLVLRPFNFNTLAVRAFELASDERLADAALPSLTIVIIGLIPVYMMVKLMVRRNVKT